jgi:aspartate kinase
MSVKVIKFGGSSVADPAQIRKIREIVEADPERRYVVVSAPGKRYSGDSKITDLLIMLKAIIDNNIPYEPLMAPIKERYMTIADELSIDVDLDSEFNLIRSNIDAGCSGNYIVSRGEYLSARLISAYLGYDFVDTQELILFDSKGRLLIEQTNEALSAELARHDRAVLPGFYGSYAKTGEVCLFSRGGSDVTGSLVARAAKASVYENWTDVSGMLMADPRIVDDPLPIKDISYIELRELSYMGASVMHEDAVFPARMSDIPINIRNTNKPEDPGTIISNKGAGYNIMQYIVDDHWSWDNNRADAAYPRLSAKVINNNIQSSSFYLKDGSFLRLKNIEIGYSFLKKKVRIYLCGNDLLTFSPFKYWDPEMGSGSGLEAYPLQKSAKLGIQFNF